MTTDDYKKIAHTLPKQPGVYKFVDPNEKILYVGKAKNLKVRLASYFGERKGRRAKTKILVKKADHIEYTIVETEHDALLLESTLIKKYQPRYNVMLKDGKSYSYICIKKERFPRVFLTRRVIKDGSTYFGPYVSKYQVGIILDLIKNLFPLRTCTFNLSEKNIEKGKFKVCLEYHIKNCQAPCVGYETEAEYKDKIEQIKNILRGHFAGVKKYLKEEMLRYSEAMQFEKAQLAKEKLSAFEVYQGKSTVASTTIRNVDVFSITSDEKEAFVNYLKIVDGAIIHTYTLEMTMNLDDDEDDLLAYGIDELRKKFKSNATEIILPKAIKLLEKDLTITIPKIGDKKKLLELSEKNVKYFLLQKRKQEVSRTNKQTPAERILRTMKEDLQMDVLPMHIECFDNSNIQGTNPVASCVVFKNAKPSKRDYRKFKIKTVVGPDDFASMKEIVRRRYTRLVNEEQPLPNLIIIDGGKGQLSAAVDILEDIGILDKVTVIGIAKRLEEIFFPNDPIPLYINKKSESLKLIQQARNEAHRFAITFHRDLRSKNALGSELTTIPGIGEKTAQKLLQHFKSVKKLKTAAAGEVMEVVGKA
ncbi:MAG TPA: excinuclease ABC subunit C, partial [Phaeodactylibacter sp.]|nr:excinuclease ABC subunit C [Phaeodactylibacter sp.]